MFVSRPSFEYFVPGFLSEDGDRHWRAMALSCNFPWFILTFELEEQGSGIQHSVCVWSESDLVRLAQEASNGRLVSLGCMLPPWAEQSSGSWSFRAIHSVWRANDRLAGGSKVLIFRGVDGQETCDFSTGRAPHVDITDRRLLFFVDTPPEKKGEL